MIALLSLETAILNITIFTWLKAAAIAIGFAIVGKILYHAVRFLEHFLANKTQTDLDELFLNVIQGPLVLGFLIAGVYFSFHTLDVQNPAINDFFNKMIFILIIIVVAWFLSRFFDQFVRRAMVKIAQRTSSELDDQLIPIVSKAIKVTIWVAAGVIAASNIGIDVTAVLAGAGIAGIALAFAAQETIANVFGGMALLIDRSFKIGDRLKLENGDTGYVYEITLRSTKLRTADGQSIMIPNGQLAKMRLTNTSMPTKELRMDAPFSVAYGSDLTKVEKVVLNALNEFKQISTKQPREVLLVKMNDSSLDLVARFWLDNYQEFDISLPHVNKAIYLALQKNKIEIPYPTRVLYMKKGGKK